MQQAQETAASDSMKDKTVLITGASAGVGAEAARVFAAQGANLVLIARGQQALDEITQELSAQVKVMSQTLDVNDLSQFEPLLESVMQEFGRIDVLVNNAGYHQRGDAIGIAPEDIAQMVDVNLRAPLVFSRQVIPYMKANGGGAIVNIGSLAGRMPLQGGAAYGATKAGLRSFTYALGDELKPFNIHVGVVSPGPIDTGFIMSNIDQVEDIVFSQEMSSARQVADAALTVAQGKEREVCLPASGGLLTTISYLFPWLRTKLRPAMYRKGAKLKAKYKARNLALKQALKQANKQA
ncbi:SDR family NAD(P)-dependent oxidoreductase [Thalassotalea euphylliae]|nr:SDR family NAD(P)-dependent oxidoreductase [Thalassotalea euphylliae]